MRSIRPRAALAALLSISGSLAVVACEGVAIDQPVVDAGRVERDAHTGHDEHDDAGAVREDGGTPEVVVSSDGGETYAHPSVLPASCGRAIQNDGGIGWAPGVIAIVGGDGGVCRSTDGGVTWSASHVGAGVSSSDVISTGTAVSPAGTQIGAVERSAAGTFVAVNGGWDQWYERQRWYRSTDGVTWEVLPEGAAARSHPIHAIAHGVADPSACD